MKLLVVLAALVAVACALPISEEEFKSSFESFKLQHGKKYASEEEDLYRSKIFKENFIRVAEHNERYRKGEVTFEVGINKYSDMHLHEMVEARNRLRAEMHQPGQVVHKAPSTPWPWSKKVDWRKSGLVTGVKDQGQCGSCWAFSTTGAVEGQMAKKYGSSKTVPLSEQNLVDCSFMNSGCGGGLMTSAFQFIIDNGGIDSEESYPYTGENGYCLYNASNAAGHITSYAEVNPTEADLLHAVQTVGPVAIAIDAHLWSFNHYKSGVYYDASCGNTRRDLDHGVLAVGFGSNAWWGSNDYWIVKNSWGADWGENGYIRIARNKENHCGVATMASYPLI